MCGLDVDKMDERGEKKLYKGRCVYTSTITSMCRYIVRVFAILSEEDFFVCTKWYCETIKPLQCVV